MIYHNSLLYMIGSFIPVEQVFYYYFYYLFIKIFAILVIKRLKPVQCPFGRLVLLL